MATEAFLVPTRAAASGSTVAAAHEPALRPASVLQSAGGAPTAAVSRTAAPSSSQFVVVGAVGAVAAAAMANRRHRRSRAAATRRQQRAPRIVALAAGGEETTEMLVREAARLRAEVEELEEASRQQQRRDLERQFRLFDADVSSSVDADELRQGLKSFCGIDVDESVARRLIEAYDQNRDGVLQFEEFDLGSIQRTHEKIWAEIRAEQDARDAEKLENQQLERKQADRERLKAELKERLPEDNRDTDMLARLGSVLAYTLPILETLRYSGPALDYLPFLKPLLFALYLPGEFLYAVIPFGFGPLILYVLLQSLADNTELPKLLRFNMRQALMVTIAMFVPSTLDFIANFFAAFAFGSQDDWGAWHPGQLPQSIEDPIFLAIFVTAWAAILYSIVSSLLGELPTGIPFISRTAQATMAPTKDSIDLLDFEEMSELDTDDASREP